MDIVKKIAENINNKEEEKTKIAREFKQKQPKIGDEEGLTHKVENKNFTGTAAGVDGGIIVKSFHGSDLILVKAVATIMQYENGKLIKTNYCPNQIVQPEVILNQDALEREEVGTAASIQRLRKEITTAIQTIEEFKPNYLLLDGSIVPQNADKPRTGSSLTQQYTILIKLYEKLYKLATENNTILIGVVEDSRGKRLTNILDVTGLEKTFDTHFLYYLLEPGERTSLFKYAKDASQHNILRDFEGINPSVTYLKCVKYDRPIRIETFGDITQASEVIYALSKNHSEYAAPTPIIEADLRAKMDPRELDAVYYKIFDNVKFKGAMLQMRRNSRPF